MSSDLAVEQDEIWSKDKLNRKSYAEFLYKVICSAQVNNDEDNALIFSIDGEWGTGKSFFIDLWMQQLQKDGHLVSRFDAWKNDIIDDPLIGFISHVYSAISAWKDQLPIDDLALDAAKDKTEKIISNVKEKMLPICTEVVKGLAKRGASYLVTEEVVDFVLQKNKAADEVSQIKDNAVASKLIENKILAHNKNIQVIEKFKEELSSASFELTKALGKKGPVIIFIDELDRCRPDYAVRLLEVLKHVFNSKGICFISSANITQLEHSIKTIYGNEFNAEIYLDRFFNYRLLLPKPSIEDYIKSTKYFIDFNSKANDVFSKYVGRVSSRNHSYLMTTEGRRIQESLYKTHLFMLNVCELNNFTLRDINNLFGKLNLIAGVLKLQWKNMDVFHDLIFLLLSFVFKNKKIKRENFNIMQVLTNHDGASLAKLKDVETVIYSSSGGSENYRFLKFGDVLSFFDYVEMRTTDSIVMDSARDKYYEVKDLIFSAMGVEYGHNEEFKMARKVLDSYIDACFMAATIEPRESVVID